MRLRARLALTILAAAVPLVAGALLLRQDLVARAAYRSMREAALARMEAGGRERCERDPAGFALVLTPPADAADPAEDPDDDRSSVGPAESRTVVWAYGPDFRSANPGAPEFPPHLAAELRRGQDDAGQEVEAGDLVGRELAVRTPWERGPCAFLLVRRLSSYTSERPFPLSTTVVIVVAAAAVVVVVLIAVGPLVRRIGRLTEEMRRSVSAGYAKPIETSGDDEVAELARAFNEASGEARRHIDMLEQREETLRRFVASTTHDVMTPLTVLQGHLSAIHRRAAEGKAVDVELANQAVEDAHYLAGLVHNLGAAAKLEGGRQQVHLAPVRLDDVVRRVVERHWPAASPRAIEIEHAVPENPLWIKADVTLLEQAVSNVVGNAVRYNRPGGHVAVILEELPSSEFSLRVLDDGPGVPDGLLSRLGERGFRSDDARRMRPEGTGIGLSITRRIAEVHGLRLEFRQSEHGGLEVEFRGRHGTPRRAAPA